MAEIPVTIDHSLSVVRSLLPAGVEEQIRQHLTIANGDKAKAIKLGQYGAEDLPDFFDLWSIGGVANDVLVMPRGYAATLRAGLAQLGYEIRWIDQTVVPQISMWNLVSMSPINTSAKGDHQEPTVQAMIEHRQGIVEAPAASGKTVMLLEAIRRLGTRALVLTDKATLANQWRERAREHLNIEPGFIQGPPETWVDVESASLVIGMIPTLFRHTHGRAWPRQDAFGLVGVDEAHHAIAETWRWVISWFRARYLFGMTATPLAGDWRRPMLEALIGPVFHTTQREQLRRHNVLSRPEVQVVKTDFNWSPEGRDRTLRDPRTIYRRIQNALILSLERNQLICERVIAHSAFAQLINSDRIAHLERLREQAHVMGYPDDRIWMLTGREDKERRDWIYAAAEEGSCLILSTLAKEGMDIPRLDALHLAWPVRKPLRVKQLVGRVERTHPAKQRSIVFDYADFKQGVLRAQFSSRLEVYNEHGYHVMGLGKPEESAAAC